MTSLSRRNFLRTSALVGATALTACTVATTGSTTTVTINTAKVKAYGQAGINAIATILSITAISTAMGTPAVAAIEAAGAALSAALASFSSATNGVLTITYDDTNWKTAVDTILVDLNSVATALRSGLTAAQSTVTSTVINGQWCHHGIQRSTDHFGRLYGRSGHQLVQCDGHAGGHCAQDAGGVMTGVAIGAASIAGLAVGAIIGFFFAASINSQWP